MSECCLELVEIFDGPPGPAGPPGPPGPAGDSGIESVNGYTGPIIVLTAEDVGAISTTQIISGGTY